MHSARRTGRAIGLSMVFTFLLGMISNFKLQADLFSGEGLMVNAASQIERVGLIALLGALTGIVAVATAALLHNAFKQRIPVMVTLYFGMVVATLATTTVEHGTLVAFTTLSKAYAAAGTEADAFAAARAALGGIRDGVHYLDKLLGGTAVLMLFAMLYRLRLIPRVLAAFGVLAALLQMITIGGAVLGHEVAHLMLAPLALAFVVVSTWLMFKGFPEPPPH